MLTEDELSEADVMMSELSRILKDIESGIVAESAPEYSELGGNTVTASWELRFQPSDHARIRALFESSLHHWPEGKRTALLSALLEHPMLNFPPGHALRAVYREGVLEEVLLTASPELSLYNRPGGLREGQEDVFLRRVDYLGPTLSNSDG